MISPSQYDIRDAKGTDLAFIYSTWLKSYRSDSAIAARCRTSVFYSAYNPILDRILAATDTLTVVACLPDNPNVILGYLVSQGDLIHYVFIKEDWRQQGIAKTLWEHVGGHEQTVFTHRTKTAEPILDRFPMLIYNPFALMQRSHNAKTSQSRPH